MKKLNLSIYLVFLSVQITNTFASNKSQWKNGNYWPFVNKPPTNKVEKTIKKIKDNGDVVIFRTKNEAAMSLFNRFPEHHSEREIEIFFGCYEAADRGIRNYIGQCAKKIGINEFWELN
ncbi:MAG: hypothetical protein LBB13_01260 [Rickettsiales bacterium]|nr:hypothetical protein [Rickettsiales bacterium]